MPSLHGEGEGEGENDYGYNYDDKLRYEMRHEFLVVDAAKSL